MFQIEGNAITFTNSQRHAFTNLIAEFLEFDEAIVVRLGSEPYHQTNENVFALDYSGKLLWQIPVRPHLAGQSPYVTITRQGGHLEAINWDGYTMTIDPKAGVVLREGHHYSARPSARTPSPRKWI